MTVNTPNPFPPINMNSPHKRRLQLREWKTLTVGNALIDAFIDRGLCDLAKEFAFPLTWLIDMVMAGLRAGAPLRSVSQ